MAVFRSRVFNMHAVFIYVPKTIIAYQQTDPIKYENSYPLRKTAYQKGYWININTGITSEILQYIILPMQSFLLFEINMIISNRNADLAD